MVTRDEVIAAYRAVLLRDPESDDVITSHLSYPDQLSMIVNFCQSPEFLFKTAERMLAELADIRLKERDVSFKIKEHMDNYLCPLDLQVNQKFPNKVLLVGQCFFYGWKEVARMRNFPTNVEQILYQNFTDLPEDLFEDTDVPDFQVIQVPLRVVLPEHSYWHLGLDDVEAYQKLFDDSEHRLKEHLEQMLKYNINSGLTSFVCGFVAPQSDLYGRLMPRYDIRNIIFFIEELNKCLTHEISSYKNVYYIDIDRISSVHGKKYSKDDCVNVVVHGGALTDADQAIDASRIVAPPPPSYHYKLNNIEFLNEVWSEVIGIYRTIEAIDSVKLVVVDLDDTLWRGLIGEGTAGQIEGWPIGFMEALIHLKKRGILLAIISKNDERVVKERWSSTTRDIIRLNDFVISRINYSPKSDNMRDILSYLNILPRNVVFIDDNPVERASIEAAFPDIRTLGALPYYLKRVLLWSAETQTASFTKESMRRTEMVRSQIEREDKKKELSKEDFLRDLNISITANIVSSSSDNRFARVTELVNKTNQFNTSGIRWTMQEYEEWLKQGGLFHTFEVVDVFTNYGLVAVVITKPNHIEQFVMSCRVAGLGIEFAVISNVIDSIRSHKELVTARMRHTDVNLLCRNLYRSSRFILVDGSSSDGLWQQLSQSSGPDPALFAHVTEVRALASTSA